MPPVSSNEYITTYHCFRGLGSASRALGPVYESALQFDVLEIAVLEIYGFGLLEIYG